MRSKNSFFLILFSSCYLYSQMATAQHCSIKELFFKMPDAMVENVDVQTRKSYLDRIDTSNFIVDEKNGFLYFHIPDSPFEAFELAVFKKKDGTCIVAFSYLGDSFEDDEYFKIKECFNLYEYKNNKWKKVTRNFIQLPITGNFSYKLPREGKDIIFSAYSKKLADGQQKLKYKYILRWNGEKFITVK